MSYITFNPKKHHEAFKQGKLYEWRDFFPTKKGVPIVGRWIKVTEQLVYNTALGNPTFFVVKV